jgi:hypothetical protein
MDYQVERVKAVVRVRQGTSLQEHEDETTVPEDAKTTVVVTTDSEKRTVGIRARNGKDTIEYVFDAVFGQNSKQEDIYSYISQFVSGVSEGLNTTIFAYGQTNSGKTHTMLGGTMESCLLSGSTIDVDNKSILDTEWGVIPRAVNDLFSQLNCDSSSKNVKVLCSYMQVV